MARVVFKLPDVGEGTAEAEIVAWHVQPGDVVAEDQPLVDVMTEKATVELPSPVAGTVVALAGAVGERIAVGAELVQFDTYGQAPAAAEPAPAPAETTPAEAAPVEAATVVPVAAMQVAPPPSAPGKALAAPAVRERARRLGIALQGLHGSGPQGRITHADLDAALAGGAAAPAAIPPADAVTDIKLTGLRRRIAERMELATREIPHFCYVEEVDVTALEELRQALNGRYPDRPRLTLLPFLARALIATLAEYPQVNATYNAATLTLSQHRAVHLGIATQTPSGLLVPVLRHAERRDLWETAGEIARLAEAARAGRGKPEELSGSTLTITSLGALGGIAATPVINPPEVAIIGVNRMAERPVVRGGQIVVRRMMNLSSSFDHRIIDGFDAAAFIQKIKALLESPGLLLVET